MSSFEKLLFLGLVIPTQLTMISYFWYCNRKHTSKDEIGWLMEKLCLDKNDEFLMIPILCPPLMEELFEQIYKIFIRSFAVGERERYPKRNYSLIGLDENPLAIIQKLNPFQKLRDHYDIKLDADSIMSTIMRLFTTENTDLRPIEENLEKSGTTLAKEINAVTEEAQSSVRKFGNLVTVENESVYLPLNDKPTESVDVNSTIFRAYSYLLGSELGQAITVRALIAGSIFSLVRSAWQKKILKELHLHRFRLHELRIRKNKNHQYFAEMKHFNIRQMKNPVEYFETVTMETMHSVKAKLMLQRSMKARIPIISGQAEKGWTSFKSSTASGWTKFDFHQPVTEFSTPLENLVVDKPRQDFVEALEYARGQYVLRDPKNRTEQLMIRDQNVESLRHIYLQRLITDFSDVFDLIDEIENDFLQEMRIFEKQIKKNKNILDKIPSQSLLGQVLTIRNHEKTSNDTSNELMVSQQHAIADQSVETLSMYGIKPIKETLRNRSGSIISTMVARERDMYQYKRHKRRFKYDMYFDSLANGVVDQHWKTELIELLALHPEITNNDIQLIKGTRNIFDAQMQLKIILFNLSDSVYDSANWKSLSTSDITLHYCTLKLMNSSLDHQDLLILDRIIQNCK